MTGDRLDAFDEDRPRGVLTRRERRYLIGESDIESETQAERSVRQSIREHIRHVLLDFQILTKKLDDRDRDMLIPDNVMGQTDTLRGGLANMIGFAYQLDDHTEEAFEESIEHGVQGAEEQRGWRADVTVDLEVDRVERLDEVYNRLEVEGFGSLDFRERTALLMTGRLDWEEYVELKEAESDSDDEE